MSNKLWEIEQIAFREALRELRKNCEMNQEQVSSLLGKPQSYISKYENGERKLGFLEVLDILRVFEHSVEEFNALYLAKVADHQAEYTLKPKKSTRKKATKKNKRKKTAKKSAKKTAKKTRKK